MDSKNLPQGAALEQFVDDLPGKIIFSQKLNNDCTLLAHHFPSHLIETPASATEGLTVAYIGKGNLLGNCRMNSKTYRKQQLVSGIAGALIPPMHEISWNWKPLDSSTTYMETVGLHFSAQHLDKAIIETYDKDLDHIEFIPQVAFDDQLIQGLLRNIYQKCQQDTSSGSVYIDTALNMLTVHILDCHTSINLQAIKTKGRLSRSTQRRVKDYIQAHLNQNISLEKMSSVANLSPYHFLRSFKRSTGLTPNQYLTEFRITKAKTLLKNTQMLIAEIALEVGYQNVDHFRRQFKKIVGVTPGEYRH